MDTTVVAGTTSLYRVSPIAHGTTAFSNTVTAVVSAPEAPASVSGSAVSSSRFTQRLTVTWSDLPNETGYTVQVSPDGSSITRTLSVRANSTSTTTFLSKRVWYVRVRGTNQFGQGAWSDWVTVPAP